KTARRGYRGWVTYFLQSANGGPVKIGRSEKGWAGANQRRQDLQAGCPDTLNLVRVVEGDHEGQLHDLLKDFRLQREWFAMNEYLPRLCSCRRDSVDRFEDGRSCGYEEGFTEGEDQARTAHHRSAVESALNWDVATVVEAIGAFFGPARARAFAR